MFSGVFSNPGGRKSLDETNVFILLDQKYIYIYIYSNTPVPQILCDGGQKIRVVKVLQGQKRPHSAIVRLIWQHCSTEKRNFYEIVSLQNGSFLVFLYREHWFILPCWWEQVPLRTNISCLLWFPMLRRLTGKAIARPYARENLRESHCTYGAESLWKNKVCMLIFVQQKGITTQTGVENAI